MPKIGIGPTIDGRRQPYLVATENDSLNGVCMLFGHLLTNTAQIFADLHTYWSRPPPSIWSAFRANDYTSADYRAGANLGVPTLSWALIKRPWI